MKKLFILFFLSGSLSELPAQSLPKLPEFGKVDRSELEMTDCSFEKGAEAMVLFDEGESYFRLNLDYASFPIFQQTSYHVRIKIFTKKGFENANIRIRYPSNNKDITIKSFSAQTYNLDASGNVVVTKVDKNTVYDKAINARFSEKIFAFPDVKEGSVIEYKYVLDGYSENYWYFQKEIPVKHSRFIMDFPQELRVAVIPHVNLPLQQKGRDASSANDSWYAMDNVPALKEEAFMSCPEDYLQKMELKLMSVDIPGTLPINLTRTWPGIVKSLMEDEDFGRQLKKNIPRTSDLDAMLIPVSDEYTRMLIIHKYVRNNMVWNNYDNIWALDGVKSAWKDKKGTSGEINLILINLLKDAGIKVKPVLVSTRENGIINTGVPGYDQFNKVMAYVQIGDKNYVLDATEKYTPSHLIPFDVMASEGLVIEKPDSYEWGWKVLWDDDHVKKKTVQVTANIGNDGSITGAATVNSFDYEKIKSLELFRKGIDKLKEALVSGSNVKVDSFSLKNADNDTLPLEQTLDFSIPPVSSGGYNYLSANLFLGFNKNPFLDEERRSDIFFGTKQEYTITATFFLPDGYQMETLPKNLKMITPDMNIVFKRYATFSDGLLFINISMEFKNPFYTPDQYPELREFYKKMFDLLDEKFVYKKK